MENAFGWPNINSYFIIVNSSLIRSYVFARGVGGGDGGSGGRLISIDTNADSISMLLPKNVDEW